MRLLLSNMVLRILAVVLTAGVFFISISFLMYGAATGLETVFVAQPWLGWVITGGVFILGMILFLKIHFSKTKNPSSDFLKISNDVMEWVQKYPYQSTGAAAAAGFIVAGKETADILYILKEVVLPLLAEQQSKQKST